MNKKINNIRNEAGDTTTDPVDIWTKYIYKYYEQLCPYKFDNLEEDDHFLKKHILLLFPQYEISCEIDDSNSCITIKEFKVSYPGIEFQVLIKS